MNLTLRRLVAGPAALQAVPRQSGSKYVFVVRGEQWRDSGGAEEDEIRGCDDDCVRGFSCCGYRERGSADALPRSLVPNDGSRYPMLCHIAAFYGDDSFPHVIRRAAVAIAALKSHIVSA